MISSVGKSLVCLSISLITILTWASLGLAIPTLSLQPHSSYQAHGDSFSLDVAISDVTDLFGFQFGLSYDPSVLSLTGISLGSFLGSDGALTFAVGAIIDNTTGRTRRPFSAARVGTSIPGISGSGILATVGFDAINTGSSSLSLLSVILADSGASPISADIENSRVSVPEPSTILLLSSGFVGLVVFRRKLQKKRKGAFFSDG
jgi:hypothetical protein